MKKIGLMGCGVVADYGHLPIIRQTPGLQLASIYDPDPARVERARHKFDVPQAFTDVDAFFATELDAIVVTSPAPAHLDNVRRAARRGLHVLCEKPLAMNDADAEKMIALMEKAGLMLFTGFCYRFSTPALQIKDLVAGGAIGDVRSLRLIYIWNLDGKYFRTPEGNRVLNERRVGRMLEGGPMVDCGVHQIDLARWWLGSEVARYQGIGAWVDEYEAPDHIYLHMDHANGAHTMIETSFSYAHTAAEPINHFSYHLIGTEGLIRYDRNGWYLEVRAANGTWYPSGGEEKNFGGMYDAFARALHTGQPGNLPSGQEGLIATRIARTATEEAIVGRPKRRSAAQ